MGRMFDNWRYASKLSRAVFVALALLIALLWTLWQWPAPRISQVKQTGQVMSAVKGGMMRIKMDNGKQVRVLTPNPVPKPGDSLPMILEIYEDGAMRATVDPELHHQ